MPRSKRVVKNILIIALPDETLVRGRPAVTYCEINIFDSFHTWHDTLVSLDADSNLINPRGHVFISSVHCWTWVSPYRTLVILFYSGLHLPWIHSYNHHISSAMVADPLFPFENFSAATATCSSFIRALLPIRCHFNQLIPLAKMVTLVLLLRSHRCRFHSESLVNYDYDLCPLPM